MPGEVEKTLESLGWRLPEVGKPTGQWVQTVRTGNLLYISAKYPKEAGKLKFVGKIGREVTVDEMAPLVARRLEEVFDLRLSSEETAWPSPRASIAAVSSA